MKNHFILSVSIAAILAATPAFAALANAVPQLPHATDAAICAADAVDWASRDSNRLNGNVALIVARKSPYVGLLNGGTIPNISEVLRSVVAERPVLGQSMVEPNFTADASQCGQRGPVAQVGTTEFTEQLLTLRGRGPKVCVKTTRTAFMGSYKSAEDGMKKQLVALNNADVRINLVKLSGCKLVAKTGRTFSQMFAGETNAISTPFPTSDTGAPDAPLNFKLLKRAMEFMKEDLLVDGWDGDYSEPIFKFVGSHTIIERIREEIGVRDDHRALTQGGFKAGEAFIKGYNWEGPYKGFAFGVDPQPLRFNELHPTTGQPIYLEPEVPATVTNGVGSRINPKWARAKHEVALLCGADSFMRRTPEAYSGEGSFKWPAQLMTGELQFVVIPDNDCNVFSDFGFHIYQMSRSYRPERPHAVMAIAFKRDQESFDLVAANDYTGYSSTESL